MSVEDVVAAAKERLSGLLAPINGGAGEDVSYDETFETIKAEIDRVNSLEGGKTDWSIVATQSDELLTEKGKDFRVALYYGAGATLSRGLEGFHDGLIVLLGLSTDFWETMSPSLKRPRARGNLCGWYNDACLPLIQGTTSTLKDKYLILAIQETFSALDGLLSEKLGEAYPGMAQLRDNIRGLVRGIPADAPPPPPPPPPPAPRAEGESSADAGYTEPVVDDVGYASGGGGGEGFSLDAITDPGTAYQALAQMGPVVARCGDVILAAEPTGADAFRLLLQGAWLGVGGAPYNEGGQTQLDGPGEHVTTALGELASSGDWMGLMNTSLQVIGSHPLCLDAVFGLATALEKLGPEYEKARAVVTREAAALLARAPELPGLLYTDGTRYATADAATWLGGLAAGGGGGGGKSPVDKAVVDAEKLVAAEQMPQAIALLSRVANQSVAPAHRFKARLEIGKLCIKAQLLDIARAQLEGLERVAEEHRLAAWDPELVAEMYANLYRVQRTQGQINTDDLELQKKTAQSFERLCQLDAAQAFRVTQELSA